MDLLDELIAHCPLADPEEQAEFDAMDIDDSDRGEELSPAFYSRENRKRIEESINEYKQGKVVVKSMTELDAMADE